MKKKNLISKWLNFNLSDTEEETFNSLDVSDSYRKIDEAARHFKAPEFDVEASYKRLLEKRSSRSGRSSIFRFVGGIAAAIVVCLGLFYFLTPSTVTYIAQNTENKYFTLPDGSEVILNDGSEISYNENSWEDNRGVILQGEAYFKVEKGGHFQVATSQGLVTVLGTAFNIKDRTDYFELSCYEGTVSMLYKGETHILNSGESIQIIGDSFSRYETGFGKPGWLDRKSVFKSTPFQQVVNELERQYNVTVTGELRNAQTLFTGSFYHENLDTALQAITIPLKLEYSINGKNVILKSGQ